MASSVAEDVSLVLLLLFGAASAAAHTQASWNVAADEIVRLEPAVFENVPPAIRKALSDQGCSIPQTWGNARPHNIVSGAFAAPEQNDWAALCSRNARSAVVVFWGGPARCPPLTASRPDRSFLQDTGTRGILLLPRTLCGGAVFPGSLEADPQRIPRWVVARLDFGRLPRQGGNLLLLLRRPLVRVRVGLA